MISIIVPTHNRSHTLVQVLDSFFIQKNVSEIIVVDDASEENLSEILRPFTLKYPQIPLRLIRNETKSGAAFCRKKGLEVAYGDFILFADDDLFLERNYTEICLKKILGHKTDLVSGRLCYREKGESISDAIKRFGQGFIASRPFDIFRFRLINEAIFDSDIFLPFTHAVYLCRKDLLKSVAIDPFYSRGNGFREETDPQVSLLANDVRIMMTNETHVVHMHMSEVKSGGQRVGRFERFYWTLYYTHYFLNKHYPTLKKHTQLPWGRTCAFGIYSILEFYVFFIRPFFILPSFLFKKIVGMRKV